jgi:hypothetical protein
MAAPTQQVEESHPPGWHTHDGFFFRFQVGPGLGALTVGSTSFSYAGFGEQIALGWAVSPRIVLFVDMGVTMGSASNSPYGNFAVMATYCVRASYYFQNNLFVGGGVGLGLMGASDTSKTGTDDNHGSNRALALRLEFGQEYWVSANWALGWVLNLAFATAGDKDVSNVNWTGVSFSPAFSVSYN